MKSARATSTTTDTFVPSRSVMHTAFTTNTGIRSHSNSQLCNFAPQRGRRFMEPLNTEQLVTIQFKWGRELKMVSTRLVERSRSPFYRAHRRHPLMSSSFSLIGVSPEFEMALYTMCFLNGQEENHVLVGPYHCNIKCFTFGRGNAVKIGSAFPEALPMTQEQAAIKMQAMVRGRQSRQHRSPQPPPPSLDSWGPPPGQAAPPQPPQPAGTAPANAWGKPLTFDTPAPSDAVAPPPPASADGAWAKPHKW